MTKDGSLPSCVAAGWRTLAESGEYLTHAGLVCRLSGCPGTNVMAVWSPSGGGGGCLAAVGRVWWLSGRHGWMWRLSGRLGAGLSAVWPSAVGSDSGLTSTGQVWRLSDLCWMGVAAVWPLPGECGGCLASAERVWRLSG